MISMLALLALGATGSVWLASSIAAQGPHLPADAGDLSNAATVEVKDVGGAVVLRGHFVEIPEDDDDIERKAELIGSGATAKATGQAEVEVSRNAGGLHQELEVSVTNLMPGATYSVFVDARLMGTFQTNQQGRAELELDTAPAKQP
jgi:hypothetical protein